MSPIYARDVAAWWTFDGLDSAIQTDFKTNGLDYLLQNPIPAYGTVVGWWFFDSKVQCAVPLGSKVRFRISLTTFSDIKFEYTTAEIIVSNKSHGPGSTEGETMGPQFVVPPNAKADISKYYRRLGAPLSRPARFGLKRKLLRARFLFLIVHPIGALKYPHHLAVRRSHHIQPLPRDDIDWFSNLLCDLNVGIARVRLTFVAVCMNGGKRTLRHALFKFVVA